MINPEIVYFLLFQIDLLPAYGCNLRCNDFGDNLNPTNKIGIYIDLNWRSNLNPKLNWN